VLYARTYSRLVGVVALAASSQLDAEECVQEAFVRLLGSWSQVSQYDDPEAWVRKVALRLLSNRRRSIATGLRALRRHGPTPDTPPPTADGVDVRSALAALTLGQRQVVVLHYLVGCPVDEVATELGLPTGTVKSRLSRARAVLAPLLAEGVPYV
jgi:RNA polymerase sigma-70 factor (ECF subfamily)